MTGSDGRLDAATQRRLGGGFDRAAETYASSRPGYPPAAVDWLLGTGRDVLDLGAGSGLLTLALAERAPRVVAADPSRNLLAELGATGPAIPAVQTGAEALPFGPMSFDVVTVATAFHWFDASRALPELRRVLKPGGWLALVWNTRMTDGAAWTRELRDLLRSVRPPTLHGDWGAGSARALDDSASFERPQRAAFDHVQGVDRAGLVSLVASRSYVIALAEPARAELLDRVVALFDAAATDSGLQDSGLLGVPYRTECFRSAVRP